MATDKEIIEAMNIIKNHCQDRLCQTCACWSESRERCIVQETVPSDWKTEDAKDMDN